jgi:predicted ATP-grasp superfamily ATP-dependent carboligase
VFARRSITIRDSNLGNERESLADLPHPGEHIERGRPICTVLAQAATLNGCRDELFQRAARVYRSVSAPIRRAS